MHPDAVEEMAQDLIRERYGRLIAPNLTGGFSASLSSPRSTYPRQIGRSLAESRYPLITISGPSDGGLGEISISTSSHRLNLRINPDGSFTETCERRLPVGGRSRASITSIGDHPSHVSACDSCGEEIVADTSIPCVGSCGSRHCSAVPTPRDVFGGGLVDCSVV